MFKKVVVIDCWGHLLGRLASIIAKELLNGQHIVCVRCEDLNVSGSIFRNRIKYQRFLRLRMNSNPRRGPYHFRAPSKILWRTIRGMLPHKTPKGQIALNRLKVFEGIPPPYDKKKRLVVPSALKTIRLKPGKKSCRIGDISNKVGWKHDSLVRRLEDQRRTKCEGFYKKKIELRKKEQEARQFANEKLPKDSLQMLQKFGYA